MSTEFKQGVVEKVHAKQLDTPDQFGNLYRIGLLIDGVWFGLGSSKQDNAWAKNTGEIQAGTDISFMFTTSGDFKNIQKTTVNLTTGEKPSGSQAVSAAHTTAPVQARKSDHNIGIAVGAAFNQAALLVSHKAFRADSVEAVKDLAIQLYFAAEEFKENPVPPAAVTTVIEESQPEEDSSDDFDDDIPF